MIFEFHRKLFFSVIIGCALFLPVNISGQHNGNNLLFQGVVDQNRVSAMGQAYGNAMVSRKGLLDALFYNPAGLNGLEKLEISFSAGSKKHLERDNQNFYPGNEYLNTSLYFEGLIVPDPAWNGMWNYELGNVVYDSLGNPIEPHWSIDDINWPVKGVDDYSKAAADHEQTFDKFSLDHISAALPLSIAGRNFVAAVSYQREYNGYDYDWNGVHLDPHWGTSDIIPGIEGETTTTNWSVFTRERKGDIYSITGALAATVGKHLHAGVRLRRVNGETIDSQTLDRVGYILAKHQQSRWAFSYDTLRTDISGTSHFSALQTGVGFIFSSSNFNIGLNLELPYSLERKWAYTSATATPDSSFSYDSTGTDRVSVPASMILGFSAMPGHGLILSFEIEKTQLRSAEYDLDPASNDSLTIYQTWPDQLGFRLGLEYQAGKNIVLRTGYQAFPGALVPYGAAFRKQGPPSQTFTMGLGLDILHGRFDLAASFYRMKYYDAYMTNRNFTLEQFTKFTLGYTLTF